MKYQITSRFLQQETFRSSGHTGIDFAMTQGTELRSIRDGVVERIVDYGNQNVGKGILIKWEDGKTAIYGHLSEFASTLREGDVVNAGDLIGFSGNSGHVVGANGGYHLHFGIKENGQFIDPSPYVNDIQHMNDVNYFVNNLTPYGTEIKISFYEFFQQHMDLLTNVKLNIIHFFTSTDYFPIIKFIQNVIQFIFFNI